MRIFKTVLRNSMVGILSLTVGTAQQKPQPKSAVRPGIVSGRVFAVTQSGDLKPARMAKVYLLYHRVDGSSKGADAAAKEEKDAGLAWLDNLNKSMEENLDAKRREMGEAVSEAFSCQAGLLVYQNSLVETLEWASDEHKDWQILMTDADEDGGFKIAVDRPGMYMLVAHGQAGFNDAFWDSEFFVVKSGSETSIKLSSPEKACQASDQ